MLGVFAEFERSIIQERVKAGMERARKHGTKSGKPIGQPSLGHAKVEAIRSELARGTGILKTARGMAAKAAANGCRAPATIAVDEVRRKARGSYVRTRARAG